MEATDRRRLCGPSSQTVLVWLQDVASQLGYEANKLALLFSWCAPQPLRSAFYSKHNVRLFVRYHGSDSLFRDGQGNYHCTKAKRTKETKDWEQYRRLRNLVTIEMRRSKLQYFEAVSEKAAKNPIGRHGRN